MKNTLSAVLFTLSIVLSAQADDPVIEAPKPKTPKITFTDIGEVEFEPAAEGTFIRYTLDGRAPSAKSFAYSTPIRVCSSLKLKAAAFKADGKTSSTVVEVECVLDDKAKKDPAAKLTAAVNIDFSEVPDLKDWALRAQKDATDNYDLICKMIPTEGFTAPRQAILVLYKDMTGVANTVNTKISFAAEYIRKNPKDVGTTIHEMAHVIQHYTGRGNPSWLVEGVADYVRWFNWEPVENRRRVNPARAKYTNGYSDAAAFLVWIEKTYDKDFVKKVNSAMRKGTFKESMFKDATQKDTPELWAEFIESLTKKGPAKKPAPLDPALTDLGLNDKQKAKAAPIFQQYRTKLKELADKPKEEQKKLNAALLSDMKVILDAKQYEKLEAGLKSETPAEKEE